MSSESAQPNIPGFASGSHAEPGETKETGLDSSGELAIADFSTWLSPPLEKDELGWLAHYRILKVLGHGGMGVVFQAEDSHLRRTVAVKAIRPEIAAHAAVRERFLREARGCAALKNDHVVTIHQVGQDRDIPYIVMEFLQGESLESRLCRGELLPAREVLRIGREIADGLAAAHGQGLIHRDIKPANIWIEAPSGRVKLLDFGLVREAGARSSLTQAGKVVGTPEYMSPEQARGEALDARSDLFSLGSVLYALCSGKRPFDGTTVMAVLTALAVSAPPPLRDLNPNVPPALADLVERLMEKDPAKRPGSAQEVQEALQAIEAGVPAKAARTQLVPGAPTMPVEGRAAWRPLGWVAFLILAIGLIVPAVIVGAFFFSPKGNPPTQPIVPSGPAIRIGVLHSRTGTMAISERPVIDAVQLAVEEINEQGGVLGRPVEAVVADGQSDEVIFAGQAEKLIVEDKVCTIFGCWTSASRKAVLPVVERHNHLLYYPVQYEGVEQSPHIIYGGPVPNQQILPALSWLVGFQGKKRWFLVGSDYVFPVTANAVIRDEAKARGCAIVGEDYLLLGSTDVATVVAKIEKAQPDLIINTINGDTNVAFFRALRRAGITAKQTPTLSLSISEEELSTLGPRDTEGDYVSGCYFQSLENAKNREFLERFGKRYGAERVVSSAMATAYNGVHLWAKAVKEAGRAEPRAIRDAMKGQQLDSPQGPVRIDPATQHTIQIPRVGRLDAEGKLGEVYLSPQPIVPEPFPASRSEEDWKGFLLKLHNGWGGRWSNPGP